MRLEWTDQGCKTLENIFACSRDFYSKRTLKILNADLKNTEKILSVNPLMGQKEPIAEGLELEYRHIVLSYPFKLIYFIWEETIYIADIWDCRQEPESQICRLKNF